MKNDFAGNVVIIYNYFFVFVWFFKKLMLVRPVEQQIKLEWSNC